MGTRTYKSKVQRVVDGDTFVTSGGTRVRLAGVNLPELPSAAGQTAKQALERLVANRRVAWTPVATDKYGRRVAEVRAGNTNVNLKMKSRQESARRK